MSQGGKLVVLVAFDMDEDGNLQPAFEPREMQNEEGAILAAMELAPQYRGARLEPHRRSPARGIRRPGRAGALRPGAGDEVMATCGLFIKHPHEHGN